MSIGLCCQYIEPVVKRTGKIEYKNLMEERTLQYGQYQAGKYTDEQIVNVWLNNLTNLLRITKRIKTEGYSVLRISSSLLPLHDSCKELLRNDTRVISLLASIGDFVKTSNMRLTCHPDQFVVLSSNSAQVIENSVKILEHHAWVFDTMGLDKTPYYSLNLHGGARGNSDILIDTIESLPDSCRKRLTLENDEKCYSTVDLYEIWNKTKIPITFDSHHYTFNTANLSLVESLELACSTWGNIKPLTHLSNTEPGKENLSYAERRKHSDHVHYIPEIQKELNNSGKIDIDFEFKLKNIAIKQAVEKFSILL